MTTNDEMPQEELEKMISEAELEAQIEEGKDDAEVTAETEVTDAPSEEPKPGLSKARQVWRRILLWLVILAITFAGGFFFDSWMRYQPQKELVNALTEDVIALDATIVDLEAEIDRIMKFEEENLAQAETIQNLTIHLTLLSARASVADAALAVEQDRTAEAKLALDKLGSTLETLKDLLSADQAEVVENMIQRHRLVMIELEEDSFSVQTDLELISSRLNTLEATLFASP